MKVKSHKILQVANRKTSVKLTVEFTREVDIALDKVISGLPKTDGIAITKENVVVAATENYLDILHRNEEKQARMNKLEEQKREEKEKIEKGARSEKIPPVIKEEGLFNFQNSNSQSEAKQ